MFVLHIDYYKDLGAIKIILYIIIRSQILRGQPFFYIELVKFRAVAEKSEKPRGLCRTWGSSLNTIDGVQAAYGDGRKGLRLSNKPEKNLLSSATGVFTLKKRLFTNYLSALLPYTSIYFGLSFSYSVLLHYLPFLYLFMLTNELC